ncbi:hypothetical protein WDU94_010795 [Cyamophila willieti]
MLRKTCLKFHHVETSRFKCSHLSMRDVANFHKKFYENKTKLTQDNVILKHCVSNAIHRPGNKSANKKPRLTDKTHKPKESQAKYFIRAHGGKVINVCKNTFLSVLQVKRSRVENIVKRYDKDSSMPYETRGKGGRLIILHAGNSHGFIPGARLVFKSKKSGDYHNEMNSQHFIDWFEKSFFNSNSVIVMDNAPYHSKKMDKVPTKSSTRKNILSWLFSQTLVPENSDLRKCELEKILEFNKLRFPPRYVYVVFSYNHAEDINNRGHHASPIYDEECKMLLDNNTEHWKCKKHRKIRSFMNKMEKTEKISLLTRVSNDPRQCIKQWVEKFPITKDEAVNLIPSLQSWLLQKTWFLRSAINGGCVSLTDVIINR